MCSLTDSPENAKYESLFDSEILNTLGKQSINVPLILTRYAL